MAWTPQTRCCIVTWPSAPPEDGHIYQFIGHCDSWQPYHFQGAQDFQQPKTSFFYQEALCKSHPTFELKGEIQTPPLLSLIRTKCRVYNMYKTRTHCVNWKKFICGLHTSKSVCNNCIVWFLIAFQLLISLESFVFFNYFGSIDPNGLIKVYSASEVSSFTIFK